MSSILKALRKLEEEKAAMGTGGVDIARDILKRSSRIDGWQHKWSIVFGVFFAALVTSGVGFWFLFNPSGFVSGEHLPILAPTPPQAVVAPTKPLSVPVVAVPEPVKVLPAPLLVSKPSQRKSPAAVAPSEPTSVPIPAVIPEPTALNAAGLPFLQLSAIVYRQDPQERLAILNDLPVMRGTSIEGAEVMDILPDRVLMQWHGQKFALQLSPE